MPKIGWEGDLDETTVRNDYGQLESYSISLLDTAADVLSKTKEAGWDEWQAKYPHLADLRKEAAFLRGFLHSTSHSLSSYGF